MTVEGGVGANSGRHVEQAQTLSTHSGLHVNLATRRSNLPRAPAWIHLAAEDWRHLA